MDQIVGAILDSLLTLRLILREVVQIDLIAEITQHKIGNHKNSGDPNYRFYKTEHFCFFALFRGFLLKIKGHNTLKALYPYLRP
jgi:hypothetical protein